MNLNKDQIKEYHTNGFLIINELFTKSEINRLKKSADKFEELKETPNVICERNGEIRSIFAPHQINEDFTWLYKQERIVNPVKQLLENKAYLYQYKLNNKKAFGGDFWEWHQDFPYWSLDDGVKEPKMISAMILFQDTSSIQGPLIFIPGSHRNGVVNFEEKNHLKGKESNLMNSLSADLKYTINKEVLKKMAMNTQLIEAKGKIGTCVFFHPNLFHASNSNISPFDRYTAILTYNDVSNLPENRLNNRPEYICLRNFDPIESSNEIFKEI